MDHTGVVVAAEGNTIRIRFPRSKACAHCGACMNFGSEYAETVIENSLHAMVGDHVQVELAAKSFLKASLLVYVLPLLALLAGLVIASACFQNDLAAAGMALVFAGVVYLILKLLEPKFSRMKEFKLRMIKVINADEVQEKENSEEE